MKLLRCNECLYVFSISDEERKCECGECGGYYLEDGLNARYWGNATPLGFANPSFYSSLGNQPESGMGELFTAFVIPKKCSTFVKTN